MEVFDGLLPIAFSQGYVQSPGDDFAFKSDLAPHDILREQGNGLLGGALEDVLYLTTGTQDGYVGSLRTQLEKGRLSRTNP